MTEVDVRLVDVVKKFGEAVAVDHINLEVRDGEFFSLLGPSGCGKTTTLRMIGGFEEPTSGLIELQGGSAGGQHLLFDDRSRVRHRRRVRWRIGRLAR